MKSFLLVQAGVIGAIALSAQASVVLVQVDRTAQAASRVFPVGGTEINDVFVQTTSGPGLFDYGDTTHAQIGVLSADAAVRHTSSVSPGRIYGSSTLSAAISPPPPHPHGFDIRDGGVASVIAVYFDLDEPTPFSLSAGVFAVRSVPSSQFLALVGLANADGVYLHAIEINAGTGSDTQSLDVSGVLSPGRYRLSASAGTNVMGSTPLDPAVDFEAAWSIDFTIPTPSTASPVLLASAVACLRRVRRLPRAGTATH